MKSAVRLFHPINQIYCLILLVAIITPNLLWADDGQHWARLQIAEEAVINAEAALKKNGDLCKKDPAKIAKPLNKKMSDVYSGLFGNPIKKDGATFMEKLSRLKQRSSSINARIKAAEADCAKKKLAALKVGGDIVLVEPNDCREKAPGVVNDVLYKKKGAWKQRFDNQWGIKQVGFNNSRKSAWKIEDGSNRPVIVAVIDTGLDWNHKDFDWQNLWRNDDEIPGNGVDDDGNGFIDDTIGWNFIAHNNSPWDDDGHGTFVAGIIAAKSDNKIGIAGINKGAKIMVLKALNAFGHTRASILAQAIYYAVDNGAKVINMSIGGPRINQTEQMAVDYAHNKGVLVIMAAGNMAIDTADYVSGLNHVITVASSNVDNNRSGFSNWGQQVDITAPGSDILSLRARRTDLMFGVRGLKNYHIGDNYVGKDKRYFHASGTSFSAPMVSATASLIWAKYPELSNTQVKNMLLNSAQDIEAAGWDQLTGYGLLNASAALKADPNYWTVAKIRKVAMTKKNGTISIEVFGSLKSSDFKDAWLELGFGDKPKKWKKVSPSITEGINNKLLGNIDVKHISKRGKWTVRLFVSTNKHGNMEARSSLNIN